MQIFLDSADQKEIEKWLHQGIIDGLTTSPSIMFKDCVYDIEQGARSLCALFGDWPVSVEVTTDSCEETIQQAGVFARWAQNVVVKIPGLTRTASLA